MVQLMENECVYSLLMALYPCVECRSYLMEYEDENNCEKLKAWNALKEKIIDMDKTLLINQAEKEKMQLEILSQTKARKALQNEMKCLLRKGRVFDEKDLSFVEENSEKDT